MTRIEKLELAKELGYTCDFITGKVFGLKGQELGHISDGYTRFTIWYDKKDYKLLAHNFIWFMYYGEDAQIDIDHINRDRSDNRICNLRSVTRQENQFNTNAKGFYWHKQNKKWCAVIHLNNKKINLGCFDTKEEAHEAYLEAKKKYHQID